MLMSRLFACSVIALALLGSAAIVFPERFDRCGLLDHDDRTPGCVIFLPFEGGAGYSTNLTTIPDSLGYTPVRIQGQLASCPYCSADFMRCIAVASATRCPPSDLGCGILYDDPMDGCSVWVSPIYGQFQCPMWGHSDRDTVGVNAVRDWTRVTTCANGGWLWSLSFYDCPDSLSAVEHRTWGTLKSVFR
jgi:hypothetical protein